MNINCAGVFLAITEQGIPSRICTHATLKSRDTGFPFANEEISTRPRDFYSRIEFLFRLTTSFNPFARSKIRQQWLKSPSEPYCHSTWLLIYCRFMPTHQISLQVFRKQRHMPKSLSRPMHYSTDSEIGYTENPRSVFVPCSVV